MAFPVEVQEKYAIENDIYDPHGPNQAEYVNRLLQFQAYLDRQIGPQDPEGPAIRRRLIGHSGLAGGRTNFYDQMYDMLPRETPTRFGKDNIGYLKAQQDPRQTQGFVHSADPTYITINPTSHNQSASRLLPHEIAHIKQFLYDVRAAQQRPGWKHGPKMSIGDQYSWQPYFTPGFLRDISKLNELRKDIPYSEVAQAQPFRGQGFGSSMDETIAYLIGREGELRSGQTLRDDPYLKKIWENHPGMYDEYIRSRDNLRRIQ